MAFLVCAVCVAFLWRNWSVTAKFNEITPYLDGGLFYGTEKAWSDALRSFSDGLLASADETSDPVATCPVATFRSQLPRARPRFEFTDRFRFCRFEHFPKLTVWVCPLSIHLSPFSTSCYPRSAFGVSLRCPLAVALVLSTLSLNLAPITDIWAVLGNRRGNENPMMLSLHILWFREHNYQARRLKALHPDWNDERLFFTARKWVIALHQVRAYSVHVACLHAVPCFLITI